MPQSAGADSLLPLFASKERLPMPSRRIIMVLIAGMAIQWLIEAAPAQNIQIQEKVDLRLQGAPTVKEQGSFESDDAKTLQEAGLSTKDPGGLLQFFRARTLAEVDRTKLPSFIENLPPTELPPPSTPPH